MAGLLRQIQQRRSKYTPPMIKSAVAFLRHASKFDSVVSYITAQSKKQRTSKPTSPVAMLVVRRLAEP